MSDKIAWAAGLFEGEGCSSWSNSNRHVSLQLATTDEDVVKRFKRAIGNLGNINGPYKPKNPKAKPYWLWSETKYPNVVAISNKLRPFLGERRIAKLDQVLALYTYRDNF